MVMLVLLWLPFALPIHALIDDGDRAWLVATVVVYLQFLALQQFWGRRVHRLKAPLRRYGWVLSPGLWRDSLVGLGLGFSSLVLLYGLKLLLGWASLGPTPPNLAGIVVEGLLTSLAVGFAEELLFRGWLLFELEADYSPSLALGINAVIFALAHYTRPWDVIVETWPQFFGLLLLGATLVWARRTPSPGAGRRYPTKLGYAFGLHSGLVWGYYIVSVSDGWMGYTHRVPAWLTGIQQNPLAGLLGLTLLAGLAAYFYRRSRALGSP